jgi:deoxyribodipyrimidine photo-lyase
MRRVVPAGWHCAMTPPMRRALVWLKRDLRIDDHVPLAAAAQAEEALAVLVIEPAWTNSPEFDPQHLAYLLAALAPLRHRLAARGLKLRLLQGALPEAFAELHAHWPFDALLSHEETGPAWSYTRDRTLRRWCAQQGVHWREWPQTGVQRALRQRSGWAGRWQRFMDAPAPASPASWRPAPIDAGALPGAVASRPLPGVDAQAVLHSFLHERGRHYRRDLGSPLSAERSCSRLSPLLSFGLLSLRQVHQATEARIAALQQAGENGFAHSCAASRRGCAGIATSCRSSRTSRRSSSATSAARSTGCGPATMADFEPARRGAPAGLVRGPHRLSDGRRLHAPADRHRLAELPHARDAGELRRLPPVACTGAPGLHLARQFLDFEPGIHWSQMQMQSGTTGINTLRIYSPRKQALDHDPEGATSAAGSPSWARRPTCAHRRRAQPAGAHQDPALRPARTARGARGGGRHPAAPWLAQEWPAAHGQGSARRTGRARPAAGPLRMSFE